MFRSLVCVLCLLAMLGPPQRAFSQSAPVFPSESTPLQQQADSLFKQILVDPKNLDIAFRYAEISSALGDYEAAIGALERMLFYSRDLPRVELELGLIYFRLGSYEMSRSHFEKAISSVDTPDDIHQRVTAFEREIDRRLSPNQYSVHAQAGLRFQTNANSGPDSAVIRALGFDATLTNQFRQASDWNHFGLVNARYSYDFENQRGDTWESGIVTYYARQWSQSRLNLGLVEVDTGPRLSGGIGSGWTIRPYALANVVTLADRDYLNTGGGGLSLRWQSIWWQIEPSIEFRSRRYQNSTPYPTASDQSGRQWTGALAGNGMTAVNNLRWQARLSTSRVETTITGLSYRQFGIELALPYEFGGFFGPPERAWTIAPAVAYLDSRYGAPYAIVDPVVTRHDRQWIVGATLDMGLWRNVGLALQVQYLHTASNLSNYRTQDLVVTTGPTIHF